MIEWLQTRVFPEAVKAQSFGPEVKKFIKFTLSETQATDHFSSDVIFGDVTVATNDSRQITESVIVKTQTSVEVVQKIFDCDAQFHNEVLFYTKILPVFKKYDTDNILVKNFPEFIYGHATNGLNRKDDVIILKSLHPRGLKMTDERLFIDKTHIKLALDIVAKFHALSIKCAADNPTAFQELTSQVKKCRRDWIPENLLTISTQRGIIPLQNNLEYKDRLTEICKHCERARHWHAQYSEPSSSLNVITHGDFSRNNMMFKYGPNGDPTEVVLFDLATIKFCSPAIDLSYFLFLNAAPEVRRLHFDEFMVTYYETLSDQVKGYATTPSFEDIIMEMRKRGMYGYHLCSFFIGAVAEENKKDDWESLTKEEIAQRIQSEGGEKVTFYCQEIVKHMLDKNYIFDV